MTPDDLQIPHAPAPSAAADLDPAPAPAADLSAVPATGRGAAPAARPSDTSMAEQIGGALREEIVGGVLEPGARLRQEELAQRFDASRVPVREALRQLEDEGLVTQRRHTGAWVTELTAAECAELYLIRENLEPVLISQNVPLLRPQDHDRLAELHQMMLSAQSPAVWARCDRDFHALTYSAARTSFLTPLVTRLWNQTHAVRRGFIAEGGPEGRRIAGLDHALLVDALRARDTEEAAAVVRLHVRRTRLSIDARTTAGTSPAPTDPRAAA